MTLGLRRLVIWLGQRPKGILNNLPDRIALFKDGAGRRINLFAIMRLIQILGPYLVAACMRKFTPRVNRTKMLIMHLIRLWS
jgi:hypothetical protein